MEYFFLRATDAPTSIGADPTTVANNVAAFVKEFDLDGVDVDYEVGNDISRNFKQILNILFSQDFNAMNAQDGSAEVRIFRDFCGGKILILA